MGLPRDGVQWPPADCAKAQKLYDVWGAWYSGDPAELSRVYEGTATTADPKFVRGGVGGALTALAPRMFWGVSPPQGSMRLAKLHIPLAADIASTSSDLVFGEPPAFRVPGVKRPDTDLTQQRMDLIIERGGVHSTLLEAGEICSAYGGVYLRAGWDKQVADHVLIDAVPPDAAVPQWRSGVLAAVTFWRELHNEGERTGVWRHLEHHERGRIWHAVYRSADTSKLGSRMPLESHPDTAPFARLVNSNGWVETGAAGLTVEYVPNMRPNRRLRGSPLGRSDFDGIEPVLDGLDESWSSWMRDLRNGKGKVIAPDVYLQNQGRGRGAVYDPEQEVFVTVSALPNMQTGMQLQVVQFEIRVAEHDATCTALMRQAVRGAGYSAGTFGDDSDGPPPTATEVNARWRRSFSTRNRKIEYFRSPLARLWETALQVDRHVFRSKITPVRPEVEWPDGVAIDPESLARTLQLLEGAKAASTRTKVEMLHPDWDDKRVREEAKEIDAAGMPPVPPPGADAPGGDTGGEDQDDEETPPTGEDAPPAGGRPPVKAAPPGARRPAGRRAPAGAGR